MSNFTLCMRLAAVEAELAEMKKQQKTVEELSNLMRKVATETIKNAQRPGGILNAAQKQAAIEFIKADGSTAVRLGKIS